MRVITFSKKFPVKHPKAGQDTGFVEAIINGSKKHTIRAGYRWKIGDRFSGRVWRDRPYASPQIEFVEIEILKIWEFDFYGTTALLNNKPVNSLTLSEIAANDGLSLQDFKDWFLIHPKVKKTGFQGQILCWDENVKYTEY